MSKYVTTYSGLRVFKDRGIPSLEDVAISLCRTPMFAGAIKEFYSVAHHSIGVAMLMPKHKIYGLFHEVEVAVCGDCPGPAKIPEQKIIEKRIQNDFISMQIWSIVEQAD